LAILTSGEFQANLESGIYQTKPQLISLANGGYLVLWQHSTPDGTDLDRDELYAQRFNSQSEPLGEQIHINQTTSGAQPNISTAKLNNGNIVVSWTSSEPGLFPQQVIFRLLDSNGNAISDEIPANTPLSHLNGDTSTIATADGGFLITWERDKSLYGQKFNADGLAIDDEVLISTDPMTKIVSLQQGFATVQAVQTDLQTSYDISDIVVQVYNNEWQTIGNSITTNSTPVSFYSPNIFKLDNEDFLVTWTSYENNDAINDNTFKIQKFSSDGSKKGDIIEINSPFIFNIGGFSVIPLTDGDFLATWDCIGNGIYAQKVDQAGNLIDGPFRVSSEYQYQQKQANGISLNDGSIVVGWSKNSYWDGESGDNIFVKHFAGDFGGHIGSFDIVDGLSVGDAGNSLSTATGVVFSTTPHTMIEGAIGLNDGLSIDTADFFKFTSNEETLFHAQLSNLSEDLDLTLFSQAGEILAQSQRSGITSESIDFQLTAQENYYIQVRSQTELSSSYQLNFYNTNGLIINPLDTGSPAIILENGDMSYRPALNIALLYGALGRFPDREGFDYFYNHYATYYPDREMATIIVNSDEFIALTDQNQDKQVSNPEFLNHMYENVLQRAPDAAGFQWWQTNLDTGVYSQGEAMAEIIDSDEYLELAVTGISNWSEWDSIL